MDSVEIERLETFFEQFKYKKPKRALATSATLATKSESSIATEVNSRSEAATELATAATKPLDDYLTYLKTYVAGRDTDLPDVPPFPDRPERRIAWSAWWGTVEGTRESRDSRNQ